MDAVVLARKELRGDGQGLRGRSDRATGCGTTRRRHSQRCRRGHDAPDPGTPRPGQAGAARRPHRSHAPIQGRPNRTGSGRSMASRPAHRGHQAVVILQVIDDHSRQDLALRAAPSENGHDVWARVWRPSNDTVTRPVPHRQRLRVQRLTSRLDQPCSKRTCARWKVSAITSSTRHPQTCGKNERAHATVFKWLAAQPHRQPPSELQALLDTYRALYNTPAPQDAPRRADPRRALSPSGPSPPRRNRPDPATPDIRPPRSPPAVCIGSDQHPDRPRAVTNPRRHTSSPWFANNEQIDGLRSSNQLIGEYTQTGHDVRLPPPQDALVSAKSRDISVNDVPRHHRTL